MALKRLALLAGLLGLLTAHSTAAFAIEYPMCIGVHSCKAAFKICVADREIYHWKPGSCERTKANCDRTGIWLGYFHKCRVR